MVSVLNQINNAVAINITSTLLHFSKINLLFKKFSLLFKKIMVNFHETGYTILNYYFLYL